MALPLTSPVVLGLITCEGGKWSGELTHLQSLTETSSDRLLDQRRLRVVY